MTTKTEQTQENKEAKRISALRKELLRNRVNEVGVWLVRDDPGYDEGSPTYDTLSGRYFDVVEYFLAGQTAVSTYGTVVIEKVEPTPVPLDYHIDIQKLAKEREELMERVKQIDASLKKRKVKA